MNRMPSTVLMVMVMTALLAALGIALEQKGYAFGARGVERLDAIASAATFMPLAALYAFAAALMMLLPLRAAGYVYANAASPIHAAASILLATVIGLQVARFAFGEDDALWTLVDWQFVFAVAIIVAHMFMNHLRRNLLMRTLFFIIFLAAAAACLFWTFRL
ncbi:hypothetical protein [Mesorhizobium sp. CAU 1741]|uniref:hypothetical protein n=1 Tax=Mesorhizobium sp. CAU 1741 TaxID=3140366 RepID=UPI00325B6259